MPATTACTFCEEERCAEDDVSSAEGREGCGEGSGGQRVWVRAFVNTRGFVGFEVWGSSCGGLEVWGGSHVFLHQSIHDTLPTIHQIMCRPKAHKMAVSCPAAIYVDISFCFSKRIRRRKHQCEHATAIRVTHAHTHRQKLRNVWEEGKEGEDSSTSTEKEMRW